jgi:hypothetical protein
MRDPIRIDAAGGDVGRDEDTDGSKEFGGSLQSSLLLRLSRSISMLLTECSTQEARPCDAANPLAVSMTSSQHVYEVDPRKDRRDVDLICDVLPFRSR